MLHSLFGIQKYPIHGAFRAYTAQLRCDALNSSVNRRPRSHRKINSVLQKSKKRKKREINQNRNNTQQNPHTLGLIHILHYEDDEETEWRKSSATVIVDVQQVQLLATPIGRSVGYPTSLSYDFLVSLLTLPLVLVFRFYLYLVIDDMGGGKVLLYSTCHFETHTKYMVCAFVSYSLH